MKHEIHITKNAPLYKAVDFNPKHKPNCKGRISTEKTVWCGLCQQWDVVSSNRPSKDARDNGWRLTKEYGWICKEH